MNVRPLFVAHAQPPELIQPSKGESGWAATLRAYELQDLGLLPAVDRKKEEGADYHAFDLPARILKSFGIIQVRLLSSCPEEVVALRLHDIDSVQRISCDSPVDCQYPPACNLVLGRVEDPLDMV